MSSKEAIGVCLDHDYEFSLQPGELREVHMLERDQAVIDETAIDEGGWVNFGFTVAIVDVATALYQMDAKDGILVLTMAAERQTSYPDRKNPTKFVPMLGADHKCGYHSERTDTPAVMTSRRVAWQTMHKPVTEIFLGNVPKIQYCDYGAETQIRGLVENSRPNRPNDHIENKDLSLFFHTLMKHLWFVEACHREFGDNEIERAPAQALYERYVSTDQGSNGKRIQLEKDLARELRKYRDRPVEVLNQLLDQQKLSMLNEFLMHAVSHELKTYMIAKGIPFVVSFRNRPKVIGTDNLHDLPPVTQAFMTTPLRNFGDLISQMNLVNFFMSGQALFDETELKILIDGCNQTQIQQLLAEKYHIARSVYFTQQEASSLS